MRPGAAAARERRAGSERARRGFSPRERGSFMRRLKGAWMREIGGGLAGSTHGADGEDLGGKDACFFARRRLGEDGVLEGRAEGAPDE